METNAVGSVVPLRLGWLIKEKYPRCCDGNRPASLLRVRQLVCLYPWPG